MTLDGIQKKRDIHCIYMDNLDVDAICEWLHVLLNSTSSASTRELATALHCTDDKEGEYYLCNPIPGIIAKPRETVIQYLGKQVDLVY